MRVRHTEVAVQLICSEWTIVHNATCAVVFFELVGFYRFIILVASVTTGKKHRMRFQNPQNEYVETANYAFLWCLLFGCLYFAVKGIWGHAVVALVLAIGTAGFSWLVYPFFAKSIVANSYLRRGWVQV